MRTHSRSFRSSNLKPPTLWRPVLAALYPNPVRGAACCTVALGSFRHARHAPGEALRQQKGSPRRCLWVPFKPDQSQRLAVLPRQYMFYTI
jgi:hypothetical protein